MPIIYSLMLLQKRDWKLLNVFFLLRRWFCGINTMAFNGQQIGPLGGYNISLRGFIG